MSGRERGRGGGLRRRDQRKPAPRPLFVVSDASKTTDASKKSMCENKLKKAITERNTELAVSLLKEQHILRSDLSTKIHKGNSFLHVAVSRCEGDDVTVLQAIIKHRLNRGKSVDLRNNEGQTPLHFAARLGKLAAAQALINAGAYVSSQDKSKASPLHYAISRADEVFVMLLIDSGASISLVGPNNQTPVKLATAKLEEYLNRDGDASLSTEISSLESINVAFSKIHNSHRSQFLRTLGQRDVQKIEALLETIPVEILRPSFFHSVSQNGTNALLTAVKTRQPAIVRILLDKGANPAIQSTPASSPLHEAVSLGEYEIVAELLTSGALWQLKNRSGRTPLDHALNMNPLNWRVIEVLLERTLDDFPEGFLPASEVLATISFCLRVAATSGAITTLSMLISSTLVDINAQTGTGWTALHIAVSRGHFKAAKLLLEGGANPNITTSANFACIHVAIEAEYSEAEKLAMAELLIEHGADVNQPLNDHTLLHMAVKAKFTAFVDLLLARTTLDPNLKHPRLHTPLWIAFTTHQHDTCCKLIQRGATCKDITYFKNVPIPFEAIRRGVSSLVRQLIIHDPESIDATYIHPETGVSLLNLAIVKELDIVVLNMLIEGNRVHLNAQDQRGNTALHTACVMRRPDIVEKLLNNGANPNVANASNVVPAAIAAEGKDLKSLHLLHDAGATLAFPPIHGKSSLHIYASLGDNFTLLCQFLRENPRFVSTSLGIAIKLKDPAMLELMFSLGLGVNQVEGPAQRSILHRVIDSGSMKLVEKVLAQQSVEINARDAHGWTPLHTAIQSKKKDIVRLLLRQSGIDLLCTTEDGLSALHLASAVQDMEDIATELLAKNNSNVNAETITGKTALNFAARHRRWNLSASLIAEGASKLDTKLGGSDWSVLHLAAANGFLDTVKIALKGLDMNRINRQESHGWTPLHLAVVNGHFEVAEELLNAGASPVVSTHKRFTPLHTLVKKYLPATSNTSPKASAKANDYEVATKIMDLLLAHCTKEMINTPGPANATALDVAILSENLLFAEKLFATGATTNKIDLTGRKSALHFATNIGNVTAVTMLLKILREKYPDSDNWLNRRRGRQGITALHLAANSFSDNSIKILRLLWNAGADPTIQDWFGNTALHSAIRARNLDAVRFMSLRGTPALRDTKDNMGRLPIDLCPRERSKVYRIVSKSLYKSYRSTVQEKHEKRGNRVKGQKAKKKGFLSQQIRADQGEAKILPRFVPKFELVNTLI